MRIRQTPYLVIGRNTTACPSLARAGDDESIPNAQRRILAVPSLENHLNAVLHLTVTAFIGDDAEALRICQRRASLRKARGSQWQVPVKRCAALWRIELRAVEYVKSRQAELQSRLLAKWKLLE